MKCKHIDRHCVFHWMNRCLMLCLDVWGPTSDNQLTGPSVQYQHKMWYCSHPIVLGLCKRYWEVEGIQDCNYWYLGNLVVLKINMVWHIPPKHCAISRPQKHYIFKEHRWFVCLIFPLNKINKPFLGSKMEISIYYVNISKS